MIKATYVALSNDIGPKPKIRGVFRFKCGGLAGNGVLDRMRTRESDYCRRLLRAYLGTDIGIAGFEHCRVPSDFYRLTKRSNLELSVYCGRLPDRQHNRWLQIKVEARLLHS